jgi:methionyl-tRNA formyltransferase
MSPPFRFLFWGTESRLSYEALAQLLAADLRPDAVVIPAPPLQEAPVLRLDLAPQGQMLPTRSTTPGMLALSAEVPVWRVGALQDSSVIDLVRDFDPAVVVVACFPRLIPATLLAMPPHGFLNVHPSLLPAYRGPVPAFWQFRDGLAETGVTLHRMDETFDTGAILAQTSFEMPPGISGPDADIRYGQVGGRLLVENLGAYCRGEVTLRPQGDGGQYLSRPQAADFWLDTAWPAERAFRFMRGTQDWYRKYPVRVGDELFRLRIALDWRAGTLGAPVLVVEDLVEIQFADGVLTAR